MTSDERVPRRIAPLKILHLDEHVVVVDKPAGVLSVRGRGQAPTVPELLRSSGELRADDPLRVVHRLDREASGVMIFARTLTAQRMLVEQFSERQTEKRYIAIVGGYVADGGEVDLPLVFDKRRSLVKVSPTRGKESLTRYHILERIAGNTVLDCRPVTGRMHQIRVHMAAIGHPLAVDPLYGGGQAIYLSNYKSGYRKSERRDERPLIARLTLHAAELTVRLPDADTPTSFTAPPPKDIRATIDQLRRALKRS